MSFESQRKAGSSTARGQSLPGVVLGENIVHIRTRARRQGQKKKGDRSEHMKKGKSSKRAQCLLLHLQRPQSKP